MEKESLENRMVKRNLIGISTMQERANEAEKIYIM